MEIKARVALSLPNTFYKVTLKYDTFEKATYDSYLMASLVANAKSKREAFKYIDEITGKGSLNPHFKKLYEEISSLSEEQINGIIENSLFPVTIINQKNHFKYYPMFDATRMNDRVYDGNLKDNIELLKELIMPKEKNIKFLSIDFDEEEGTLRTDNYNAIFSDTDIKVDLDNGQYYSISKDDFDLVYQNDVINLDSYLGDISSTITDGNWNVLSNSIVGTFAKSKYTFKDSKNRHCVLYLDCLKTIEIINVFGLYFYKDTRYDFSLKNSKLCEDAVNYLMKSKNINEFKTKSLIFLLGNVDEKMAQEVVQYVLGRKDSKEISELGLELIKNGLEKGWNHEVLLSIKKQISKSDYIYLYRIDNNLDFSDEDLLIIDDIELSKKDKSRKNAYLEEKNNILKRINSIIGEITNSGIREKIKILEKTDLKNRVKKFVDKRIGHTNKDYENMSMDQIKKELEDIQNFYSNDYKDILKIINKVIKDE